MNPINSKKATGLQMGQPRFLFMMLLVSVLAGTVDFNGFNSFSLVSVRQQEAITPIGVIQGDSDVSPLEGRLVEVRGIVTGVREDRNLAGILYYSLFIQDLPGAVDGNSATSDGIAVFQGTQMPKVAVGDVVRVRGEVVEYYGNTEIDSRGGMVEIEIHSQAAPAALEIDPPEDDHETSAYLERFEGMLVRLPESTVVGPSHRGCGFAVVREKWGQDRIIRHEAAVATGHIVEVLHKTDTNCDDFIEVSVGDGINGITGPLIYDFERFKIIQQSLIGLTVQPILVSAVDPVVRHNGRTFSLATFNLQDYFDTVRTSSGELETLLSATDFQLKRAKIIYAIGTLLDCPTIIALQEVENRAVLEDLSQSLMAACGFAYQIIHQESPDSRGADLAILSDPRQVIIRGDSLWQVCSIIQSGVADPGMNCPEGEHPLYSRPPLRVEMEIAGQDLVVFNNHFKSKREGEEETAPLRLSQAIALRQMIVSTAAAAPQSAVIVAGDFNDYAGSPIMRELTENQLLVDALSLVPENKRYSYNFGGVAQLLDWILVSPPLFAQLETATILHTNSDYAQVLGQDLSDAGLAFRSSDHDVPVILWTADSLNALAPEAEVQVVSTKVTGKNDEGQTGIDRIWSLFIGAALIIIAIGLGIYIRRHNA